MCSWRESAQHSWKPSCCGTSSSRCAWGRDTSGSTGKAGMEGAPPPSSLHQREVQHGSVVLNNYVLIRLFFHNVRPCSSRDHAGAHFPRGHQSRGENHLTRTNQSSAYCMAVGLFVLQKTWKITFQAGNASDCLSRSLSDPHWKSLPTTATLSTATASASGRDARRCLMISSHSSSK